MSPSHNQAVGDVEFFDELGRHCSAAGLDAAGTIQQHHVDPGLCQIVGRRGPGGATPNYDDVIGIDVKDLNNVDDSSGNLFTESKTNAQDQRRSGA